MSKYIPHLLVLCEDQATHDIATGFNDRVTGAMEVKKPLRGWPHVLQEFKDVYIPILQTYSHSHIALIIDFDNAFPARLALFQAAIPPAIADRVFVLGALDEAEMVKKECKQDFRKIGIQLAVECIENSSALWASNQIAHNDAERQRLQKKCRGFLL